MRREILAQCAAQGDQRQWDHRDSENRVTQQDREIQSSHPALPLKRHRTDLVMIDEIRDQKQDRTSESDEHASPMALAFAGSDKQKTTEKKNSAETVQRRVHGWQIGNRNQ